ncbi:MAG: DUF2868 domain-containing protein [Desulfobacteraceae bacterium]
MNRKSRLWTTEDLMDFEYFLYRYENISDHTVSHDHERILYLNQIKPILDQHPEHRHDRRFIFKTWLDSRRNIEEPSHDKPLPGAVFRQVYGFVAFLCVIIGFFMGTGLCLSFLTYHGREPLNVSSYLGIFVLSQVFLVLVAVYFLIATKIFHRDLPFSLIRFLLWNLMIKLMGSIGKKTAGHLSRETISRFESAWGIVKGKSRCYGNLFPWHLFILTQTFAVCFNIGIITATLLRVLGSDLAFGWQSTVQLSSHAVYGVVRFVSLPWSFAVNEHLAHPSLAQIEGTRMILKDGITRLATEDLVSWWPFLCFCVVAYGLVPRLVLLASAVVMKKKALDRIRFENMACDMLMLKLTNPAVETRGETPVPRSSVDAKVQNIQLDNQKTMRGDMAHMPFLALVPHDIAADCRDEELNHHLNAMFGAGFINKILVAVDSSVDKTVFETFFNNNFTQRLVCLMEAWQPPIRETMEFIRLLRRTGGNDLRIHILLVGKPSDETIFTTPSPDDSMVWTNKLNSLADPNIRMDVIPGNLYPKQPQEH